MTWTFGMICAALICSLISCCPAPSGDRLRRPDRGDEE